MIRSATLADGTHGDVRWWVQRMAGVAAPLVTIVGREPFLFQQEEMPGACRATVHAAIDEELARVNARLAKSAVRTGRPV